MTAKIFDTLFDCSDNIATIQGEFSDRRLRSEGANRFEDKEAGRSGARSDGPVHFRRHPFVDAAHRGRTKIAVRGQDAERCDAPGDERIRLRQSQNLRQCGRNDERHSQVMLRLAPSRRYRRDVKLAAKRGEDLRKLIAVLDLLRTGKPLPSGFKDHPLRGDWSGFRDLHIAPDWLLIYRIEGGHLQLARTGTHTDLFSN